MSGARDASTAPEFKELEAAAMLRALSNERRLLALCFLAANGEVAVAALAAVAAVSQSSMSQHLATLRQDGLVATRRAGTTVYYRISDPRVVAILRLLIDIPDVAPE